jgi:hypothetical protein
MPTVKDAIGVIAIIICAILLVAVLVLIVRAPNDTAARAACRTAYDRAKTPAESTVVHQMRPITSRGQATVARNCRAYSQAGELR